MDHVTAILTQLAQGLFESIGSSVLRSMRGKSPAPSDPPRRRGPELRFGLQLRLLHRPARGEDQPKQLAIYRIEL
jgi:hypothetical protein